MTTDMQRVSARDQLAALTQDRVMNAVAALLREDRADITFELVSRQSGIPQRTLYRHFPNKEAMFEAFWGWMNAKIETPAKPTSPDEVVAHIPDLFAAFDRDEPLVRAMLHNPHGRAVRLAHAQARRQKFAHALAEVTETMTPAAAKQLLATVTTICSASGWESMKDNWGLTGRALAEAAQWAVETLINGARGRRG